MKDGNRNKNRDGVDWDTAMVQIQTEQKVFQQHGTYRVVANIADVNFKNSCNLKVEGYVLFSRNFQDLSLEAASQVTLRGLLQGGRGGTRVIQKFATEGRWSEHPKYFCKLKKTRYLKLRNLVFFYIWEGERVWAH